MNHQMSSSAGDAPTETTHAAGRGNFRGLLELAGPGFFPLAFFARLPLAMLTIGTLTDGVGPHGAFLVAAGAAVVLFLAGAVTFALGRVRRAGTP